ncbi:MAG: hypothetical protein RL186_775 [Pseudomonadota bacterium]
MAGLFISAIGQTHAPPYQTARDFAHSRRMVEPPFEPIPVPLSSKALVDTLKRRLIEADETGRATYAKTFLDVIERLAKMDWLDELTPAERFARDREHRTRILADLDARLVKLVENKDQAET